jgi:hypothetical protein
MSMTIGMKKGRGRGRGERSRDQGGSAFGMDKMAHLALPTTTGILEFPDTDEKTTVIICRRISYSY